MYPVRDDSMEDGETKWGSISFGREAWKQLKVP
jgi:hypothetical protein